MNPDKRHGLMRAHVSCHGKGLQYKEISWDVISKAGEKRRVHNMKGEKEKQFRKPE